MMLPSDSLNLNREFTELYQQRASCMIQLFTLANLSECAEELFTFSRSDFASDTRELIASVDSFKQFGSTVDNVLRWSSKIYVYVKKIKELYFCIKPLQQLRVPKKLTPFLSITLIPLVKVHLSFFFVFWQTPSKCFVQVCQILALYR